MKVSKTKIVRFVLSTILLVFAGLQLNDPDPWSWILLYGLVATLGVMGSSTQNLLRIGVSVLYVCLAYWRFPTEYYGVGEMSEIQPEIEQAREAFGVLIAAGINATNIWLFAMEDRLRTMHPKKTKCDDAQ